MGGEAVRRWILTILAFAAAPSASGAGDLFARVGGADEALAPTPPIGIDIGAPDALRGNPLWRVPLASLSATRERPLFDPSRRPQLADAPPTRAVAAPPPPSLVVKSDAPPFQLIGTVLGGKDALAILRNQSSQATTPLREGQTSDGWRAQKVSAHKIVVEKDGNIATLELWRPKASPVPADEPGGPPDGGTSGIIQVRRRK
jgi:general secretion pathway protein N